MSWQKSVEIPLVLLLGIHQQAGWQLYCHSYLCLGKQPEFPTGENPNLDNKTMQTTKYKELAQLFKSVQH